MANDEPGHICDRLLSLYGNISLNDGPEVFLRQFRAAPPEVGHLYAGDCFKPVVDNGGIWSFYEEYYGMMAPEVAEAYRAIGIPVWAKILEETMAFFGPVYPRDVEVRRQILRERGEEFPDLDDDFYSQKEHDRWYQIADQYAAKVLAKIEKEEE